MGFAPLSLWHSLEQNQIFKVERKYIKELMRIEELKMKREESVN